MVNKTIYDTKNNSEIKNEKQEFEYIINKVKTRKRVNIVKDKKITTDFYKSNSRENYMDLDTCYINCTFTSFTSKDSEYLTRGVIYKPINNLISSKSVTSFFGDLGFQGTKFINCTFENLKLYGFCFDYCIFEKVKFINCNLYNAHFQKAILKDVEADSNTEYFNDLCPKENSFIGYKAAYVSNTESNKSFSKIPVIVELEVPADAMRSSATTKKCRCNKAKVLSCYKIERHISSSNNIKFNLGKKINYPIEISSFYDNNFSYKIGENITCKAPFDENRWKECASGIHFFMNSKDAINYGLSLSPYLYNSLIYS